jgi:glycosyltransferase involved in cell wall biosynthesis
VCVQANGRHLGAAATRNCALVRSRAEFVQNLDADDQLLPGSLEAAAAALREDEDLAFAFGRTVHLMPDGTRQNAWRDRMSFAPGRIAAGRISDMWLTTGDDPLPISPLMWRKRVLLAYGGWTALPTLEDTAVVMAVASSHPSVYLDADTQLYRIHRGQATIALDYRRQRRASRQFMFERLRALAAVDGREHDFPEAVPADPADRLDDTALRRGLWPRMTDS